jgi:hypothetical protein
LTTTLAGNFKRETLVGAGAVVATAADAEAELALEFRYVEGIQAKYSATRISNPNPATFHTNGSAHHR